MKRLAAALALAFLAVPAYAQMKGMDMKDHKGMESKKDEGRSHHAVGTVKSVDVKKGTVTLDHEPVASMNWPRMTMAFKAKDKKALEGLKPGQKVEVDFVQQGKDYVITKVK